jgi:predicted Holliday junction resolvase-like endonuclease
MDYELEIKRGGYMIDETITLALIIFISLLVGFIVARKITKKEYDLKFEEWIKEKESEIREDAKRRSRVTLGGKFSEQLAPFLPGFNYDPTDVKFLGDPIDMVVFKGRSHNKIEEIVFLEIKTGKKGLDKPQRMVKEAIENNKVKFKLYRVPDGVTKF